jgi:hypothetical protein
VIQYIYVPLRQVKRCIRIEMVYQTSGEIYYLRLILLKRPVLNDEDSCNLTAVCGGGKPIVFLSYQQSAVAHGYVESAVDAQLTFDDKCRTGTAAQCRSYFVILTLHSYATHAIFEIPEKKRFMYQEYIIFQYQTVEVAQQMTLQDLEKCFCKSHSSLKIFGFPAPDRVPTELEEALLHWNTDDAKEQQGLLLKSLNVTVPNNPKQQLAFDTIMESIDHMVEAGRDEMTSHVCHIITGPGESGKLALFRKLHAAYQAKGLLISTCDATGLAALLFDGATTAHSLFNYPVEEEDDVDDQDCPQCNFNKQQSDFLKEVSVIFWEVYF